MLFDTVIVECKNFNLLETFYIGLYMFGIYKSWGESSYARQYNY